MMLEVENVHVGYDGLKVLRGVSLHLEQSSIATVIGPNGAGKTTMLKTVCGTKQPTQGEIWFQGRRIEGLTTEQIVGLGIAHVPEGRRIFPHLTVLENLQIGAYLLNDRNAKQLNLQMVLEVFPVLDERKKQKGGSLSGGEQQMLAIARALMSSPKLVLMDEPTLGLSPLLCKHLSRLIRALNKEQRKTILLVEQNARMALNLADHGYLLEAGVIVLEGACLNLKNNERVSQVYLGSS